MSLANVSPTFGTSRSIAVIFISHGMAAPIKKTCTEKVVRNAKKVSSKTISRLSQLFWRPLAAIPELGVGAVLHLLWCCRQRVSPPLTFQLVFLENMLKSMLI